MGDLTRMERPLERGGTANHSGQAGRGKRKNGGGSPETSDERAGELEKALAKSAHRRTHDLLHLLHRS